MVKGSDGRSPGPEQVVSHYASGYEGRRLYAGSGQIERERTREMLERFLPAPPATVLDIGGGPGGHACWLAQRGYEVHLVDITPLHVRMARKASAAQPATPLASASVGDARALAWRSETIDAALLLGPLYHLTRAEDRLQALREAYRALRAGGVLLAAGISRYASLFDGLRHEFLKDPQFAAIVSQDLEDGQHRNSSGNPSYFMDTFFHHPEELRREVAAAGFQVRGIYGVEGPAWLAHDLDAWWSNETHRELLLRLARVVEEEPSLSGVSAHLVTVASK
jgi:ubiquinone/menaquinone biosynthesis C-methylase UbiE